MSAPFLRLTKYCSTSVAQWENVSGIRSSIRYMVPKRCLHVHSRQKQLQWHRPLDFLSVRVTPISAVIARWNSSQASDLPPGYIPDPPPVTIPDPEMTDFVEQLNSLGEPTLQSLGLAGYSPSGLVQQALEALHVGLDIPWWGSICVATIILRILIFPVLIKSMKFSTNFSNHIQEYQKLNERMNEAKRYGDYYETMKLEKETREYFATHNLKLRYLFLTPLVQAPIFISVFAGFRGMAYLPVESMKMGGLFWFHDLTLPDPYCILPVVTAATMLLQLELGSETAKSAELTPVMKWGMRCMPVMVLFVTWNFPAAMLCYWFTSNTFSLLQGILLRTEFVGKWLDMPKRKAKTAKKKDNVGMVEKLKTSWDERKILETNRIQQKHKHESFKKQGSGPIEKTYAYDPTKVRKQPARARK